jgi:DNA-binding NtrC family response regulator
MDGREVISENTPPGIPTAPLDDPALIAASLFAACILITGKSSVLSTAHWIHDLRGPRQGPFIAVDCGLPEGVVERRLFDVLRQDHPDRGEPRRALPIGSTIFLEEVWKLSPGLQARLLEALEDPAEKRGPRRLRAHVIASSSEPLLERVMGGSFDDRLFYRLNAVHLVLPPDSARPSDVLIDMPPNM